MVPFTNSVQRCAERIARNRKNFIEATPILSRIQDLLCRHCWQTIVLGFGHLFTLYIYEFWLFFPYGDPCPYSGPTRLRLCLQVRSSNLSLLTSGFSAVYLTVILALGWPPFSFKRPLARGILVASNPSATLCDIVKIH